MKTINYHIIYLFIFFSLTVYAQDEKEKTFEINKNITLIGGYPTNPKTGDVPDPTVNKTILNGELRSGINAYHVLTILANKDLSNVENRVVIDGVTISGGNANQIYSSLTGYQMFNPLNGGGIIGINCNLDLKNCTITNNNATTGAGIYLKNNVKSLFKNCTFYGNTASDGGGIYIETGDIKVDGGNFVQNKAVNSGGALSLTNGIVNILNSTFTENEAGLTPIKILSQGGGAIYNSGTLNVDSCVFDGNITTANNGEPTAIGGGAIANFGTFSINKSILKNNVASQSSGGAILCGKMTTDIQNCMFENNSSSFWGGAIIIDLYSTATLKKCYFGGNSTLTKSGGAIFHKGVKLDVINCTIYNNECKLSTYSGAGGLQIQGTTNVINSTIVGNKTLNGNGAGIKIVNTGSSTIGNLSLINSIVTFNYLNTSLKDLEATSGILNGNKNIIGEISVSGIPNNLQNTIPFTVGADNARLFAGYANNLPLVFNNGGNTLTVGLANVANNLAVKTGVIGPEIPTEDQRGYPRNSLPCIGAYELVIATSLPSIEDKKKLFYPTITSDRIFLPINAQVSVFSMSGVELIKSTGKVTNLSVQALTKGIYLVKVGHNSDKLIVN